MVGRPDPTAHRAHGCGARTSDVRRPQACAQAARLTPAADAVLTGKRLPQGVTFSFL